MIAIGYIKSIYLSFFYIGFLLLFSGCSAQQNVDTAIKTISYSSTAVSDSYLNDFKQSLNGDWQFADSTEYKHKKWNTLPVPGNWNTFTEYADYIGDGWYKKEITVPTVWQGQRIYLKFDAVYDIADVWYDNIYLGQHTGGYTPFEFDITKVAKPGKSGAITVKANNEHVVGAWFQWGGISRGVHLYAKEDLRLISQKIEPLLDVVTGTAQVKLMVNVENKSKEDQHVSVLGKIKELENLGFQLSGKVAAESSATFSSTITLNTTQTRPWHFDDPQLYHLETTLSASGKKMDMLNDRFGIRKIDIKPDGLYLNGEKVRVMGYNRVHDHRAYGNTEPRHLVRADVDMMKRSGANFSRLMHAPSSPELLDYCDERGLLLWAEIPMWQTVYRVPMDSQEDANKAPERFPGSTIREMIERDWNHPSIIGWSPGNELRGEANAYVKAMRPLVKSIDPTRFYANIHDQGFQKNSQGGFKGLEVNSVDILFMNKYGNTENKIKSVLAQHDSIPNLPIFYSEYGEPRSESLNHTMDFKPLWERLSKEPYVIGGSHWTFNDYRSYWWKANPASQNRDWGLVDVWRNPKTFYYDMSRLHWPVNDIKVSFSGQKANIVIVPRKTLEIPSFTLRGYSWLYELIDTNGRTIEGNLYALKNIAPNDDSISKDITWETTEAKTLGIALISKNGYTVAKTKFDLSTGKRMPSPKFPEAKNPDIRKVLPLDRSFMVGVTSQEGDIGLEVNYGTKSGIYKSTLTATVLGAIKVRRLENGKTYYGRVRRTLANGFGPWSDEFEVTPDGGLLPDAPVVLGIVKGQKTKAVRLLWKEKIEGYEVELSSGEKKEINSVNPGWLMIPLNATSISAINSIGKSKKVKLN